MLFDIGIGEMIAIGVIALIVLGPERLPQSAAQAARTLRQLREQVMHARNDIIQAADIDPATLRDIRELDPRKLARDVVAPVDDVMRTARRTPGAPAPQRPTEPSLPAEQTMPEDLRDVT